ncbi:MAG: hypothetical protein ACJ8R9_10845 [Steroidobacteraceae bacterium]
MKKPTKQLMIIGDEMSIERIEMFARMQAKESNLTIEDGTKYLVAVGHGQMHDRYHTLAHVMERDTEFA